MYLKQSTAKTVRFGPFVDSTDGVSPEIGLTIAQADMQLSKNGAAFAQKSAVGNATHDADGWYSTSLSTTDTNTVGELILQVTVSGALIVWQRWYVLEEAIYDSLMAASSAGFDANQRVNVGQWLSTAVTVSATSAKPEVDAYSISDDATAANNLELALENGSAGYVASDLRQMGGIAQSATDLKDFADDGYDPVANKVQGVVLVDTTTTNTDMRGTDNAALASTVGTPSVTVSDDIAAIQADTDDIQTRLPAALVSGRIDANVGAISDDATAADNLELQYDTTGLTGDTFPATQSQLSQLVNVGAAINTPAESYTLTTGTQVSGTYASTSALDGTYHQHSDTAGAMELYYQFDVGSDGVPISVKVTGRIEGANDSLNGVYAYNWGGASWDRIGSFAGQASATDVIRDYDLYTSHVGTGANIGKVRIRFYAASGLTTANLYIDQIFTSYAVVSRSVGYANGAIWIDTNVSNTDTEPFIDGTADNPVSTWAAALTLSSSLNIKRFHIANGSSITLSANSDNYEMTGIEWDLALNGQSIAAAYIFGANVSGTSAGLNARFIDCRIGTCSLTAAGFGRCALTSAITLLSADDYIFEGCFSSIAGTGTPSIDFGALVGNTKLSMRHYGGGIEIQNMGGTGTDTMSLEGEGQLVLNANCSGGTIAIRGHFTVTDNAGGAVTLSDNARYDTIQINDQVVDVLSTDTFAEPAGVPAATATIADMIHWLFTLSRNKATQTNTTKTIRNDTDTGDIATATISDTGTTFTRDEYT